MKIHRILCLCAIGVMPQLALADPPTDQALGIVQATLDFCTQVDPKDAAAFQSLANSLAQGQNVSGTTEYKQAYDLISAALKKVEKRDAAAVCAAGAKAKKS